jgi:hypothetical protein
MTSWIAAPTSHSLTSIPASYKINSTFQILKDRNTKEKNEVCYICKELSFHALIPVLVASFVASSSGLNMGLNATVNAQSTMYPTRQKMSINNASKNL